MIVSLLWPGVLTQPAKSSFHVALGDLATWLLAVFALGALTAAGLAYLEQRKAGIALADQVEDQQKANALQAKVLERTLGALARSRPSRSR